LKSEELFIYSDDLILLLREVIGKGAVLRFQARGYSMSPFIKHGDIITVAPLKNSIKTGDVVAFIGNGKKLIVHRIIGKIKNSFVIKGDNLSEADGVIPENNILGYVRKVERDGTNISLGLGNEQFLIALFSRLKILKYLIFLFRILMPSFIRRLIL
jgi:signal peptidase I